MFAFGATHQMSKAGTVEQLFNMTTACKTPFIISLVICGLRLFLFLFLFVR